MQIASRPGAQNLRCLFRVTFVPTDAYELLRSDPMSFEYLYVQASNCCMGHGRFETLGCFVFSTACEGGNLKQDIVLKSELT